MNFYNFSLCHFCKKSSSVLKKCSSCKIVYYCCRSHQKLDWSSHKEICQVITKSSKVVKCEPGCSAEDFNYFKYATGLLWGCQLQRLIQISEIHMWMFPKVCSVCFSSEADIVCQDCRSVAYCSEEHQTSHKQTHDKFCRNLKICFLMLQSCTCIGFVYNWAKFKITPERQTLPEDISEIMKFTGLSRGEDFSVSHFNYIGTADMILPAINIIYALEKAEFIFNRRARHPQVVIHVVSNRKSKFLNWKLVIEFIMHWISNLTMIWIYVVDVDVGPVSDIIELNRVMCHKCKAKNILVFGMQLNSFYYEAAKTLPKPNIVVVINNDVAPDNLWEDEWKKSIPWLVHHKAVPLLLTSATEDRIKKEISRFNKDKIKFIVNLQENPYAGLRPCRDWREGNDSIYFNHKYIAVLTKK